MIEKSSSDVKKTNKSDAVSVSCWNCFIVENDNDQDKEVPLSEVRKDYRQNFKLYSVFASEVSRPKAVPIKQKLKENYTVGKKIEKKIINKSKQNELAETIENNETSNDEDTSDSGIERQSNKKLKIKENCSAGNKIEIGDTKGKKVIEISKYHNECLKSKTVEKDFDLNTTTQTDTKDKIKENYIADTKIEKKSINKEQKSVEVRRKIIPQYLESDDEVLETKNENTEIPEHNQQIVTQACTVDDTIEKKHIPFVEKVQPTESRRKVIPEHKQSDAGVPEIKNQNTEIPKQTKRVINQPSPVNATIEKKHIPIVEKVLPAVMRRKIIPEDIPSDDEILEIKSKNTEITQHNKHVSNKTSPVGKLIKKFESTELQNNDIKKQNNKPLGNDVAVNNEDSVILYKVQIETSTPKLHKETKQIDCDCSPLTTEDKKEPKVEEIENIIMGIQNLSILENDEKVDKTDNISSSESGYDGSSLRDINDLESVKKNTSQRLTPNKSLIPVPIRSVSKRDSQTSLPALNVMQRRNILKSTKSLCGDTSDGAARPAKSLRWSTLDLPHRSTSVTDEVYLSDPASPNHATLPRRSNSPLPHERDLLDRDRFSLNRSGLQARSESMASVYSGAGEGTRGSVTVRGEVQISLLYNYRLGALEVGVKRCRELAPVDTKRNRSDPYVKVYLLPDKSKAGKRKTKVKKNTLNPVFEETLSFVQPLASLSARTLWLSVWHADMFGRNDFLGEVTLPLADVVFDDPAPMWYKLHERTEQFDEQQGSRGDVIVALKLELPDPRGKGTLHALVKEAKNLVATKPNGLADVFCKSYLLPERGRLAKQKTAVCRRTLSPRWEHTFTYRGLAPHDLAARALELSLWDRDRLASNDFMGAVRLSLGTGTYMGAPVNWMDSVGKEVSLWQMMLHRPNFWVEGSFPLRPHLNN